MTAPDRTRVGAERFEVGTLTAGEAVIIEYDVTFAGDAQPGTYTFESIVTAGQGTLSSGVNGQVTVTAASDPVFEQNKEVLGAFTIAPLPANTSIHKKSIRKEYPSLFGVAVAEAADGSASSVPTNTTQAYLVWSLIGLAVVALGSRVVFQKRYR